LNDSYTGCKNTPFKFTVLFRIFGHSFHLDIILILGYLTGIDCGASGTDVVLYEPKSGSRKACTSRVLKFAAINYNQLGLEKTVKQLMGIIRKSEAKLPGGLEDIDYIIAGISGARHENDRKKIRLRLQKALKFRNIEIYPDTIIAFGAAFDSPERNCGILIAGTGSVLYYKNNKEKTIRTGGWGRHIGDEGSGYWIARTALHKLTQYYDGRTGKTSLADKIHNVHCINHENIIKKIYHNQFEISRVTKLVFDCAESGDKICKEIIKQAAEELSSHFIPLKNAKSEIALFGSLFSEEKLLENYLRKITKQKYPNIKLIKPKYKPVWGAVKIGMEMVNASR
jgi:glucosamine kinase